MIKKIFIIVFLLSAVYSFSQVGIETDEPTKELDVNGDVRIRNLANNTSKIVVAEIDGTLALKAHEDINPPKSVINSSQSSASQKVTIYDGPCYNPNDKTSSCFIKLNHYTSCQGFTNPVSTEVVVVNNINTANGQYGETWSAKFLDHKGDSTTPTITQTNSTTRTYQGGGYFEGRCQTSLITSLSNGRLKIESEKRSMFTHLIYLISIFRYTN